jgi:hypothetical protein
VDADLPGYGYSGNAYTSYAGLTPDGELWVALVEKAFAQFRSGQNSYASIHGGWLTEAFSAIAGTYSTGRSTAGTADSVAQYIQQHLQAGHAVTAATLTHGYAVLGVESVNGAWQVRLYNPYGSESTVSMATFQQYWPDLEVNLA